MEPPNLEPRIQPSQAPSSSPVVRGLQNLRSPTDQKSIFVGNLPIDASEPELRRLFSGYGNILAANVIRKPIDGERLEIPLIWFSH